MPDYPKKFEQFWKVYPRKVAKVNALTAWIKQDVEADMYNAKAAIDDIEKRTRLGWWSKDKTKIPHPATWINSQRWHDEGWEQDIEGHSRTDEKAKPFVPREPDRIVPWEEALIGRLFRTYIVVAHGLPDVNAALNIKGELMRDVVPNLRGDVESGQMKPAELAVMVAGLFLAHMDHAYSLKLKDRILAMAKGK